MSAAASMLTFFSRWIDDVAAGLTRFGATVRRGQKIELAEHEDGSYSAALRRKGSSLMLDDAPLRLDGDGFAEPLSARWRTLLMRSQVDVALAPSRFVFRPLELPRAAEPFLEGVVRAQIDRLTPWSAADAVFGWSAPQDAGSDRIAVTVAATARTQLHPITRALVASGAGSIGLSTRAGSDGTLVIPVLAQQGGDADPAKQLRLRLIVGLGAACLLFALSLGAWIGIGGQYDARLADLQNQIAERRAKLMNSRGSDADRALHALQARKRTTPSPVMVLEALSKALPDDAHLTELRIEDGKVQISGLAADASELIRLIEQSSQFTHATFFAPTVRSPDARETFHIEAHLEPSFAETN